MVLWWHLLNRGSSGNSFSRRSTRVFLWWLPASERLGFLAETSFLRHALKGDLMRPLQLSHLSARRNMVPMICDLQLPKTRRARCGGRAECAIHNHFSTDVHLWLSMMDFFAFRGRKKLGCLVQCRGWLSTLYCIQGLWQWLHNDIAIHYTQSYAYNTNICI